MAKYTTILSKNDMEDGGDDIGTGARILPDKTRKMAWRSLITLKIFLTIYSKTISL